MNTLVRSTRTEPVDISVIRTSVAYHAARVLAALKAWVRRERARDELAQLDEAMLRDIGITRADADFEASKPFWQR